MTEESNDTSLTHSSNNNSTVQSHPPIVHMPTPIHLALIVPNITNFIKIVMSIEKGQYNTWSELFKIHARVYQVLNHIIPPPLTLAVPSLKDTDLEL